MKKQTSDEYAQTQLTLMTELAEIMEVPFLSASNILFHNTYKTLCTSLKKKKIK